MVSGKVLLTQPLRPDRQFAATTGSDHHLLLDDAAGGTGPKPIELVAIGLAGCTAFDVSTVLRQKFHQRVTSYEVRVEADQAERPPQVFTAVRIHHVVTGFEIDPAAIEEAIRLSEEKYCSVGAMLKQTATFKTTYEIVEEKATWLTTTPESVRREEPRPMNRQLSKIACLVSLLTINGFAGCSGERRVAAGEPETVGNVQIVVAQKTTMPDWLEVVGTVRAAQTSQLASQIMGNIIAIQAREGERVESGHVLVMIDDAQLRAAVEQAGGAELAAEKNVSATESEYQLAEVTKNRYQKLFQKGTVSPQEFDVVSTRAQAAEARRDMARAALAQADAALAQARTSLGYTRIRAPFTGVVTERKADPGTLASPGMSILTLEDTRNYRLEVTVDESDVRLVHLGRSTPVSIDALGSAEITGKVGQIVPAADPGSRSFLVKIELPRDAHLRSGLFGRAQFARGERSALLIPTSTVVERGQLQGVYVVDPEQIAALHYVTLGRTSGQQVEVLSGLQGGEKVIAAPGDHELGGKRIVARP